MLLKGPRFITFGAVLVALGVIMVLISTYTPFGRRVLLLTSGVPVMIARNVAGKKGSASVYIVTAISLFFLVQPIKGLAYLLLAGGVPLFISVLEVPLLAQALMTAVLGIGYLAVAVKLLGLPLVQGYNTLAALLPWSDFQLSIAMGIALVTACFVYPWGLRLLQRAIEKHWAFEQIFKP